jgi:ribosomal protein S18 acetylase RimI-like enzyme
MWTTKRLTDKSEILGFLETDRLYAAYAIGDLEPEFFEQCQWFGAAQVAGNAPGRIETVGLCFAGLKPPALFLMGEPAGLGALLAESALPAEVSLTCRQDHLRIAQDAYDVERLTPMWRMVLRRELFRQEKGRCVKLGSQDKPRLKQFYAAGGGEAYSPRQVDLGIFYGTEVKGELVSVAGTHLVSQAHGIGAVGNVFTVPAWRGHNYAAVTTSAVVSELLEQGIGTVVLNVSQANAEAIRVYERLGFECYCPFIEGVGIRRPSP